MMTSTFAGLMPSTRATGKRCALSCAMGMVMRPTMAVP
jgi:hypothetical protein